MHLCRLAISIRGIYVSLVLTRSRVWHYGSSMERSFGWGRQVVWPASEGQGQSVQWCCPAG